MQRRQGELHDVTRQTPVRWRDMDPAADLKRSGGVHHSLQRPEFAENILGCLHAANRFATRRELEQTIANEVIALLINYRATAVRPEPKRRFRSARVATVQMEAIIEGQV